MAESPRSPAAAAAPPPPGVRETFLTWVSACRGIIDQYQSIADSDNAHIDYGDLRTATSDNLVNLASEYIELLRNLEPAGDDAMPEDQRGLGSDFVASIRVYRSYVIHVWAKQHVGAPFTPFPVFPNADF